MTRCSICFMWYNSHSDHMRQMHPQPVGNYANPATKRIVPDRDDLLVMTREGVQSLLAEVERLKADQKGILAENQGWRMDASKYRSEAEMLRVKVEQLRTVLRALYEWYDRDGSVGGASQVFEDNRAALEGEMSDGANPAILRELGLKITDEAAAEVERLRAYEAEAANKIVEQADEIEQLRAELLKCNNDREKMHAALHEVERLIGGDAWSRYNADAAAAKVARAALEGK